MTDIALPPEPGLYPDIPPDEYFAWPLRSRTQLVAHADCPKKGTWYDDHPQAPTAAMITGTICHSCVFEPELFDERYTVEPPGDGRTTVIKELRRQAKADAELRGTQIIKMSDYGLALAIRAAVQADAYAAPLLKIIGDPELTAVWEDPATGEPCKCRFDFVSSDRRIVIDLKTTKCSDIRSFEKTIIESKYHAQADFYANGLAIAGGGSFPDAYYLIAVEKTPPYVVTVFNLCGDPNWFRLGRQVWERGIRSFVQCRDAGHWPGYADGIVDATVPE